MQRCKTYRVRWRRSRVEASRDKRMYPQSLMWHT